MAAGQRPWTVMVYMAGDNGRIFDTKQGKLKLMEGMAVPGYEDLAEMGAVGTTPNAAVVCLFDTPDATFRIEVRRGNGLAASVVQQVPAVNTGDPDTLRQFIVETAAQYPAQHYALIVWNHGSGWLDVDGYAIVRTIDRDAPVRSPIFRSTARARTGGVTTRPIAYDDSSMDFLDSHDLHWALEQAERQANIRLDLIGMDACLMAMVEGARELYLYTDYFVASQETEPMAGWPYEPILMSLNDQPGLAPVKLAETIVKAYALSYGGTTRGQAATQSAIVVANTNQTEYLCKQLIETIVPAADDRPAPPAGLRRLVAQARDQALAFADPNYRDLGDFAGCLARLSEFESYPGLHAAAVALRDHLASRGDGSPVLSSGFTAAYDRATGLSVYLPANARAYAPDAYRHLVFAEATGWDRLLDWLCAE